MTLGRCPLSIFCSRGTPPVEPTNSESINTLLLAGARRRLPGKGNSNSHGARPVHLIITMIKWIRTSRLSIKNSLSLAAGPRWRQGCRRRRRSLLRLPRRSRYFFQPQVMRYHGERASADERGANNLNCLNYQEEAGLSSSPRADCSQSQCVFCSRVN